MQKFQNYIKDVIQEMKKVTWPTMEELKGSTMVVIIFAIVMGIFIAAMDMLLTLGVQVFL
jgi:preprotein translocase subunit SecE